ncbi:MAG: HEPN domain-containing protein [Muribaculaceae bacterium]|nr:HEPN domain-containing protein [Muribaculaceae bacterium]MDE6754395.1 HEPN domain-containing protein [Muribaculaceae bacterium]
MTADLDEKSRNEMIVYRLEKCDEALKEADYLIAGGFYSTAVNRLYYACYYAIAALLLKNYITAQTHAGVKSMLSLHFVRTGKLNVNIAKDFFRLFDLRHNNDYDDFSFCDKETALDLRPRSAIVIKTIKALIKE